MSIEKEKPIKNRACSSIRKEVRQMVDGYSLFWSKTKNDYWVPIVRKQANA